MKLPEWIRKRLSDWASNVIAHREVDFELIDEESRVYLMRWHIIGPNRFLSLYVHLFAGPDIGRHLHDHRSGTLSLILEGRYIEAWGTPHMMRSGARQVSEHRKGDIVYRPARVAHMITETYGAMTLFITGPTTRTWGFWVDGRWMEYDRYFGIQQAGPK